MKQEKNHFKEGDKMSGIITLEQLAQKNISAHLGDNPCRGVFVGMSINEIVMHLPWIMGRSKGSQDRIYVIDGPKFSAKSASGSKAEMADLIYYDATDSLQNEAGIYLAHIVSNGNQTDTVKQAFVANEKVNPSVFREALNTRHCEPDPNIFTARIIAYSDTSEPGIAYFAVLKADPFAKAHWIDTIEEHNLKQEDFESRDAFFDKVEELSGLNRHKFPTTRNFFELNLKPGFGYMITTYDPGGKTLPPFEGEPVMVHIGERNTRETMEYIWQHLEPEWRVGIGGKGFKGNKDYHMEKPILLHEVE
jgi:hypothetical protein